MASSSTAAFFLFLSVVLISFSFVFSDVVNFEGCPLASEDFVPNCTVHEVRVNPCPESAENKPCKLKRGRAASIEFDFTPLADSDNMTAKAYWTNALTDLPFIGMQTNACSFTECPATGNRRQTYAYNLDISKKFPTRSYDVKWKLWRENSTDFECCFIFKIKLVR